MMGRREKLRGGEADAVPPRIRRWFGPPAGVARYWKTRVNRRARRNSKRELVVGLE